MSPKELRAFREGLGLSRREFAPKLFISEPTLERWERGQGGPREVHLRILRRMREHLGAGHSLSYFNYDAGAEVPAELLHEERQLIIDTLKSQAVVLLAEQGPDDGGDWSLRFGLGWAAGEPIELSLVCEGSDAPTRPTIDFTLRATAKSANASEAAATLQEACFNHGISCKLTDRGRRATVELRQRLFNTGCNPETVKHVLGNYQSCWNRLRKALLRAERPLQVAGR
jgi:transcriptional regulator with XRE-family HTH domain